MDENSFWSPFSSQETIDAIFSLRESVLHQGQILNKLVANLKLQSEKMYSGVFALKVKEGA